MIYIGIATVKERESLFREAISSVYSQVDRIIAVLNNYDEIPEWLKSLPKVEALLGDNKLGDAYKFIKVEECDGYYFSIDDDLAYPPDYCQYMIRKIDKFHCIVTLHGRRFDRRPILTYRRGFTKHIHCLNPHPIDEELHVGGTGVMAFHTDDFKLSINDFKRRNMADIWVAKLAKEQNVNIIAVSHPKQFLRYLNPQDETIWQDKSDDTYKDNLIRSFLP